MFRVDEAERPSSPVSWYRAGSSREYFMKVATLTIWNEHVLTHQKGNHKGCPYGRLAGVIFRVMTGCVGVLGKVRARPAEDFLKICCMVLHSVAFFSLS